jgi:hypothetical protein
MLSPVRLAAIDLGTKWEWHAIAAGSATLRGSDGVHLADINGDGRLDVVSGHEQSHKVSVSLHPGFGPEVGSPWPTVVLPSNSNINGPEDAVFADVDGDGRKDVIVGAEGGQRVTVLFAPTNPSDLLTASTWFRMDLGVNVMRVMRVAFANVAGGSRPEIVVGGKESSGKAATIGYYRLTNPSQPHMANSWTYTSIRQVGWVMQMFVLDVDGDGDRDIVYTDREPIREPARVNTAMGLRWLESSGGTIPRWTNHPISPAEAHHKWFDLVKWDGDNDLDIVDCRSAAGIAQYNLWLNNGGWQSWTRVVIPAPSDVGQCQHITFANVDKAGPRDLGITSSHAAGLSGVIWLHNAGTAAAPVWERGEISGSELGDGIKFDNLVWYDVDNDGDLDAITSEQHEPDPPTGPGLGVIWYENPLNP